MHAPGKKIEENVTSFEKKIHMVISICGEMFQTKVEYFFIDTFQQPFLGLTIEKGMQESLLHETQGFPESQAPVQPRQRQVLIHEGRPADPWVVSIDSQWHPGFP